jgi:hypothetical protein
MGSLGVVEERLGRNFGYFFFLKKVVVFPASLNESGTREKVMINRLREVSPFSSGER